jgi:hypothetical protein
MINDLIDLTTPQAPRQLVSEFTPTLTRALADCFRTRRYSNLPSSLIDEDMTDIHWVRQSVISPKKDQENPSTATTPRPKKNLKRDHSNIIATPIAFRTKRRALADLRQSNSGDNGTCPPTEKTKSAKKKVQIISRPQTPASTNPPSDYHRTHKLELELVQSKYECWVLERHVADLNAVIEFLELERRFGAY